MVRTFSEESRYVILRKQINRDIWKDPKHIQEYERTFNDRFSEDTVKSCITSSLDEIIAHARESDFIYVSDFHTSKRTKETLLTLLKQAQRDDTHPVIALECISSARQKELDAYLAGKIQEDEFYTLLEKKDRWHFDLHSYASLFAYAKDQEIPIIGIDHRGSKGNMLEKRELHAARLISKHKLQNPDTQYFVMYGEFHLLPNHLPDKVDMMIKHKNTAERTIIYQNVDAFYFNLKKYCSTLPRELMLSAEEFCILNTPPLRKWKELQHFYSKSD